MLALTDNNNFSDIFDLIQIAPSQLPHKNESEKFKLF